MKTAVQVNCKKFKYYYAQENTLENLDFEINYGQVTLLSGLSGCGKSTLLSLINGIIPRVIQGEFEGSIFIDGENSACKSMSQISRKVGSVLQNAESQIIHSIVEDEIAFGCENFGFTPETIYEEIEKSSSIMEIKKEWKTRTLSGGQKQRLVTASTLAMKGDILIFDEPLANLDGRGAKILLELLKKLAAEGKAILLVEHRLDVVLPFVDVVWQLKNKRAEKISDKESFLKSQTDIIEDKNENHITLTENALEINELKKSFGNRTILNGINLNVKKGERILLCGENGCGKSTLMKTIARLQKADSGIILQHIDNKCSNRANKRWFKNCGVVFQNPNYQLFMPSVKDEILFGTDDKDYALNLADEFELGPLLERHPHSLSEGQKRRVTVCAILAQKPKLLLLDEPTVGQDYKTLQNMMSIINNVHRQQENTMISITHDIRCMTALCDRKVNIYDGVIK
ncbi:ABC transporter ATP-binding protein [Treponema sp.]|uniref:ABC transporter ATP-binding protein n=1 Tax=Treponema sp. TaxID=166 RepID=UPI0025E9A1CE|nr:ABC transporter ATP-binding protein [Treponema sp.]MCR5217069.1 energy-coupling factor ABC transporter ATP-binding protein [Treponema sp.]